MASPLQQKSRVPAPRSTYRTGPFIIVICGGKDGKRQDLAFQFRSRGFLVGGSIPALEGFGFVVSMSPKLALKLALESNLPVLAFESYSKVQMLNMASSALDIILRSRVLEVQDAWIAHDPSMLRAIDESKGDVQLELVKNYYGSKIAMYFGWLAFYTDVLPVPSLAGALLFAYQLYLRDVDSAFVPFFCVLISLWSTYFLEFWKRRGNVLSFYWKVLGLEDAEGDGELAEPQADKSSAVGMRCAGSCAVVVVLMLLMLQVALLANSWQESVYARSGPWACYPTVLYSILPAVIASLIEVVTERLNDFEQHTKKTEAESALVLKMFALEFCNRYCALFHAAFWLRDLSVLRTLLVLLLVVGAALNNFMELGMPVLTAQYNRWAMSRTKVQAVGGGGRQSFVAGRAVTDAANAASTESFSPRSSGPTSTSPSTSPTSPPPTPMTAKSMRDLLEEELPKAPYDLNADYLEIVIQYGYVTMFVVAFPLAPALALLNNLFESKVDLFKLAECRRSPLLQRSTIGPWQSCMEFISFLAVVSNSFLIVMVSTRFELIIPAELYAHMKTDIGRLIAMIIMEHFLLGFKLLMMYIIDDIPRWLQESVAEQHGAEKERVKRERVSAYTSKATLTKDTSKKGGLLKRMKSAGMPGLRSLSASEDVEESPSKKSQKEEVDTGEGDDLVQEAEGSLYANTWKGNSHSGESPEVRLVTEMGKQRFGFDPNYMMLLVPLPLVLESMGVTPWLYLPLAVMFFGYMQARKEKITRTVAKGIVSDAALLDMIKEELPRWTTDSEYQQMEWANYMMQKFWPMLSIVGEQKAISIGTRILGKTKTPFPVAIKKFSFGTIAPRFCGIRVHQQGVPEGVVRLDLDVRYAGDPHIVLQMGPTQVEITDMRVCTTMRCECLEFTPKMTPFKLASATMMQRPRIDFKVKVGGVDMTATETLTRMVHWMVDQVVGKVVLYPRKMFVPMGDGLSEANQDLHPVGILRITLHRGVDLIQANIFGSDPYVEIRSTREQLLKSECIYSTLNPEWEETFDVVVYDRGSQVVQFQVFDFNSAGSDKSLGTAELAVSRCIDHRKQKTLTLKDVEAGSIVLTCVYVPVGAARYGGQGGEEPLPPGSIFKGLNQPSNQDDADEDVLFDVPMAEMTSNDTLISGDLALESNEDGGQDPSLLQMAVLVISNIKLRSVKAGMGHWKPAVSFHVGTQSMKTRSQKNILNPEFDDDFVFVIRNAASVEKILVKLLDKNRGKLLSGSRQIGEVSISLYDLMNMHTGGAPAVKEKEYQLESEVGEFMIGFKMHWSPAGK